MKCIICEIIKEQDDKIYQKYLNNDNYIDLFKKYITTNEVPNIQRDHVVIKNSYNNYESINHNLYECCFDYTSGYLLNYYNYGYRAIRRNKGFDTL